jgi:hypothetical protein
MPAGLELKIHLPQPLACPTQPSRSFYLKGRFMACIYLKNKLARHWWLTPIILVTWEAEIRRIAVQSQPRQIVLETLSHKKPSQKKGGGARGGA